MYLFVHVYIYMYMYTCIYVYMIYVCICIHIYMCIYICIYIYNYMYTTHAYSTVYWLQLHIIMYLFYVCVLRYANQWLDSRLTGPTPSFHSGAGSSQGVVMVHPYNRRRTNPLSPEECNAPPTTTCNPTEPELWMLSLQFWCYVINSTNCRVHCKDIHISYIYVICT